MKGKRSIKSVAKRVPGASEALKRGWVEARRLGERAMFAFSGPPDPASAWLLASSGRSGSTWLGDMLAATPGVQQLFEPFDPRNSADYRQLMGWQPDWTPSWVKRHYLRPHDEAPEWRALWEQVLSGRIRTYLTDYTRTSFFPRRFLVKTIRANMMLGFVANQFGPTTILLARHPAAVINSMYYRVKASWPADVQDMLAQEALVEDYLQPWVAQIEQIHDGLEALIVWWAAENKVALTQLAHHSHYQVFYEWLTLHPQDEMAALLQWLGLPANAVPVKLLHRYSRMTSVRQRQSRETDAMSRLSAWQQELPAKTQRLVQLWSERFEIPWYQHGPLPVQPSGPRGGA